MTERETVSVSPKNLLLQIPGGALDLVGAGLLAVLDEYNWVAYLVLAVGTALLAWPFLLWADAKIKRRFIAIALFVFLGLGVGFSIASVSRPAPVEWKDKLTSVIGIHYRNESIVIDGKEFLDCTFENVKLIYNGTGRVSFKRYKFKGEFMLVTHNYPAMTFAQLVHLLPQAPGVTASAIGFMDDSGVITPIELRPSEDR